MMRISRIALLAVIFLGTVQGQCVEEGTPRANNTHWKTNSCTTCFCDSGIITCNRARCKDPECDTSKGQSLVIPENSCCPVCSMTPERHCVVNQEIIAHNTEWDGTNCTRCRCDDSAIACTALECKPVRCGYGEVERRIPGQCCPKCVSVEESCNFEGEAHRDGETWNPSKCERAYCNKGEVVLHAAQCDNIVCGPGEHAVTQKDECCPSCVGRSCIFQGREYTSGQQFEVDQCRQCICQSGEVTCKPHHCNSTSDDVDVNCPRGERMVRRTGSCCAECASAQETCDYHGVQYFHGDLWNISKCEVAFCSHGNVRSVYVQCSPVNCKWNEHLVRTSCCPECVAVTSSCRHNGFHYRHGDVWKGGSCKRCECVYGMTQCFTADCPACPPRTVPVAVPGECCPDCQPVTCHSDCATCDAPGYAHCTSCRPNRFLQERKCVRRCMPGFYQDGKLCKACHTSCDTCVMGNSPSACTSCRTGQMLQEGGCVERCDRGYFRSGRHCLGCPKGCASCANSTLCSSCEDKTRIPQGGACVQECGNGFLYEGGTCKACHSSCATCSGSLDTCTSCPIGKLSENGLCVDRCSPKYYQLSISRCAGCHESCATCIGSSSSQCITCRPGDYFHNGRCVPQCPAAHFANDGRCEACHSSCQTCAGSSVSDCTMCASTGQVIQPSQGSSNVINGACQPNCDRGHYLDGTLCRACQVGCGICDGPTLCTSCIHGSGVLLVTSQGAQSCVTKRRCVELDLAVDFTLLLCHNATAISHCSSTGRQLYGGNCVYTCPSGSFTSTTTSGRVCLPCGDGCESCQSSGRCESCQPGKYLSHISKKCVETCEAGYYKSGATCKACPTSCTTCVTTSSSPQPRCTSCRHANAVLQMGQCADFCVPQFYPDLRGGVMGTPVCRECDWSCTRCSGSTSHDCLECMENQKLQNGSCVATCSNGFYQSSHQCRQCTDQNCVSCTGSGQCSQCRQSYSLYLNSCLKSCPRGYYSDPTTRSCMSCPSHCLECSAHNSCSQCDARSYLIDNRDPLGEGTSIDQSPSSRRTDANRRDSPCVRQCERGYYGNKRTRRCEANRHAPVISVGGRLLVGIGSRSLVDMIRVKDTDTDDDDILLNLIMEPANGWFELNNTRIPVEGSMPFRKVAEGSLWFVHHSARQRHGVATFQATDRHLKSNLVTLGIVAVPTSKPVVTKNKLLVVSSGESAKISARSCFDVRDDDSNVDVTINIIYPPKYGRVVKLPNYETAIKSFTISDLRGDVIIYATHGNITSPTVIHDTVTLQITDGYHVINKAIHVNIMPKGNSTALLMTNKGTNVRRGGMTRITNEHLLTIATSIKDKSKIMYVINPAGRRRRGQVVLMVPEMSDAPANYGLELNEWLRTSQGHYRSPPTRRFSQRDVDEGVVWFHDLAEEEEDEIEAFEFEVYDESNEPAEPLGGDQFRVNLIRENIESPRLSRGMVSPPQMSANEGMISVLHSGFLHYTDEDTPDRDILFNITRPLPSTFGTLENADHPYVPITVFTQSDVDSNKIMYRPPVGGIPSIQYELGHSLYHNDDLQGFKYGRYRPLTSSSQGQPKLDFEYTVTDGEHTLPPINFTIKLVSSNTAPPVFANQYPILEVVQGGTATIGSQHITVTDRDTPSRDLIFTLVKAPRRGTVIRNDHGSRMILREGTSFTNEEIQRNSLQYVHNGDIYSKADQVQVSVTDGTHTIVAVIQVSIRVARRNTGPTPDPRTELSLVLPEASEVALTRENLAFVDTDSNDDQIIYHIESEPFHGLLESNIGPLVPGATFTQRDVDSGFIRYHSRSGIGSLALTDRVHFHVTDSSGNRISDQILTITITPVRQNPPTVSVGGSLTVAEGDEVRITSEELVVTDVDTLKRDLIVNVLRKPALGNIVNKRMREHMRLNNHEDVWFSMQDVADGHIYYAHVNQPDLRERNDYFTFRVTDGHTKSAVYRVNITIQPPEHSRPVLRTATIMCLNGYAILIKNISLAVVDTDTPNQDLVFTVTSQLHFGKLVKFDEKLPHDMLGGWKIGMMKNKPGAMMKAKQASDLVVSSSFTYQDIVDQKICYENTVPAPAEASGSRRRRDTLGFILSDGFNHQNGELFIDVQPERELNILQPPPGQHLTYVEPDYEELETEELNSSELTLVANTGITVERGSVTPITSRELRVTGSNRVISYVITRDPNVGQLQYARNNIIANISAKGDNEFTQEEIDQGSIRYFHPVSQGGGDVFFMFNVIGGMADVRFNIHVNDDRIPPRILTNNGLTVKEGGSRKIMTQQLSATDESGRLVYEITEQVKLGRIEYTDKSGRSINSFTQDDLVSGTVQYVHTSDTERTDDQFTFALTDGTNSVIQTFYIRVLPVDNSLPVLQNLGIRVQEGVRKTITEYELKATDRDTNNDLIQFIIVDSPRHGAVERKTNGIRYLPVTSFTMDDIYESRISYYHDGTNSLTDTFSFKVTDGTNEEFMLSADGHLVATTEAQLFHIEVVPVDDGTPRLITNLGLNHLEYMDNKPMGVIKKRYLLTEDPDTQPERIIYTVTSDPRHGHLESTLAGGEPIRTFTQADINTGLIRYVLTDLSSGVTRDSFMFNVRDSLPSVVSGNTFNIRWSVISFDKRNYTVKEEAGTVDINVLRSGNLNQYAIVLCRTEHGNATSSTSGSMSSAGQLDYMEHSGQVQFDEHETEKVCSIQINDDTIFEGTESFTVELTMATDALLGNITRTTVYINDDSDIPTIQFVETQYTVEERDTTVYIPIKRTGDIEKPVSVICFTESRTATGSVQGRIESGSDYKTRERHSGDSIVTFAPGVSSVNCEVKIIDDSVYEDSEEFVVRIVDASEGAKIGKFSEATVTITGPNDTPTVFLADYRYVFAENAGTVDIPVHRAGPDLSRQTDVWCSTKQSEPVSAVAGQDFVATSTKITFRTDETAKICSLTILDDSQTPIVEGNETFVVYLNSVQKAHLAAPHEALVIINDTMDDVPKFTFLESTVEVKETAGVISLQIQRSGDVSGRASVICYTRQNTASVEEDFTERPLTEMSRIVFQPGQRLATCNVSLVDDGIYESIESFTVRLANAAGDEWYGASVGENDQVTVTVTNAEDAPTLEFELAKYSIREPDSIEGTRQLSVTIVRTGDPSEVSKVRCSTRDGLAKSGSDYEPKSRLLRFQPGQTAVTFTVNILSSEDREWRETFLIVLGPQDPVNAVLGAKFQTTVTILDKDATSSLVLPATPDLVSLLDYDDVEHGLGSDPSPGYPLVCVTPCDPKHSKYVHTKNLCEEAAINASAIRFSWEVAMPSDEERGVPPFETVTDTTPFTSVNTKVLDSIYFGRRFHVRCVAQAVDSVTHGGGTPIRSNVVTIATNSGLCHNPIVSGSERNYQAQSFIADLRYIPAAESEHSNTLHVSVKIPHQDGRLPLISTMPFNNLKLLLSRSIDRQQHVCSNLMYSGEKNRSSGSTSISTELGTNLGFVEATDYSRLSLGPGYDKPYQFDSNVRESKTIDLYKYLNLKSCIWQFDAYYHMNELIDYCNGKVEPDFQLRDAAASQVTVTVPLYVSYVYVTAPRGWGALDHHTDMEFSFRYKNVLWRTGIQTDGVLTGRIQVLRIKIRDDGKLVIEFKTQAKFRGLFVASHRTLPGRESRIVTPEGMNIEFELTNMWSENTYDSPYQLWRAVSTYSRKDYSGEYTVELLPCTVSPTQKWGATPSGRTIPCTAYSPEEFKIPIMFQQTNRPVPVVYTLHTEFQLCNNEKVFMMDPRNYDQEMTDYDYKGSFTKGQTIFGRVLWTPEQDLKSAYRLQLEKVYLCTGRDGYVPYFDPTGSVYGSGPQYGCIEPSKNLQHRFLLLDRSNRDAEDRHFHDVPFDAYFASDRPEFAAMSEIPGVDGFLIRVDGLYKVEAGHQWYIQVLYVIGPDNMLPRVKRSAFFPLSADKSLNRKKRSNYLNKNGDLSNRDILTAGWREGETNHNGTNMRGINIDESELENVSLITIAVIPSASVVVFIFAAVFCCCAIRRRRRKKLKEADIEMVARKTIAIEAGDDDGDICSSDSKYNQTKMVDMSSFKLEKNSKASKVRVSNLNLNNCQTPLMAKPYKSGKPNNTRDPGKPLLKHSRRKNCDIQIVNNLKDSSDSGTEV